MKLGVLFLKRVIQLVRECYHTLRPQVILMAGQEKNSGELLTIGYVGNMPRGYRLGFPSQILRQLDEEVDLGPHWVWQLRKLLKANNCVFGVVESTLRLRRFLQWLIGVPKQTWFMPFFVHCVIPVEGISVLLKNNSSLKGDIKKIENAGFSLQTSHDSTHFREFIDSYYQPYMMVAHGSLAALFDYSFLCQADNVDPDHWELLQVMLDDEWVAGAIVRKDGQTAYFYEVGIRGGARPVM